jgi:hypothetical protein
MQIVMLLAMLIMAVFLFGLPFFYFICVRDRYIPLVCVKCRTRVVLQADVVKPVCRGCGIELAENKDLTREYHKLPLIIIYAGYALIYGLIIYLASFLFEITYNVHYAAAMLFTIVTTWSAFCGAALIIAKTCSGGDKTSQGSITGIAGDLISSAVSLFLYGFILLMLAGLMIALTDKCFPNPREFKFISFPDPIIMPLEDSGKKTPETPQAESYE